MQLLAIVLYSHDGRQRAVRFKQGRLNVVTGESATGKSALLDIVEFCLGRRTVGLPTGVITESVSWYGVLVEHEATRIFVGRLAPRPGAASAQRAMVEIGANIDLPDADRLIVNADADAVRAVLTRLLGIENNEHVPGPWALRPPLEASVGHALLFCFQRQSEIANRHQLFHRANEEGIGQSIRDTLPYFLGAVQPEEVGLRQRLIEARRSLRRAERDLGSAERTRADADVRVSGLLAEAVELGLVARGTDIASEDAVDLLRRVAAERDMPRPPSDSAGAEYQRLIEERGPVLEELRQLETQMAIVRDVDTEQRDYGVELGEQQARLLSIGLLPSPGDSAASEATRCPICQQQLERADPSVGALQRSAEELRSRLAQVQALRPQHERLLAELGGRANALRDRLRTVNASLRSITATLGAVRTYREGLQERAYVQGRIAQFLESFVASDDRAVDDLRAEVERLSAEVTGLEGQLDPASERDRTSSRLDLIGEDMTRWARQLRLEHSDGIVKLDLGRLTVVVNTEAGPVTLDRMGSAGNWVRYHVVAHLALHQWFVAHDRPVPRFIMLDQPTQAFYPPDVHDASKAVITDADREAVHSLFKLIEEMVNQNDGRFQVIVTDHANLPEEWFQEAVVENWRGEALIPSDWPRMS